MNKIILAIVLALLLLTSCDDAKKTAQKYPPRNLGTGTVLVFVENDIYGQEIFFATLNEWTKDNPNKKVVSINKITDPKSGNRQYLVIITPSDTESPAGAPSVVIPEVTDLPK